MFKALLLLKNLNKKLPWYLKSILLFLPAAYWVISSKLIHSLNAPAVNSPVELFFASNHSGSYLSPSTMLK